MALQDTDKLIVQRGDTPYKIEYSDLKEEVLDDVDLSEYARLDGAEFTGDVSTPELTVGPNGDDESIIKFKIDEETTPHELELRDKYIGEWDYLQLNASEKKVWSSITYSGGYYVAVASLGPKRIMWSRHPSGPWTEIDAPENNSWESVTSTGQSSLFCAVASDGEHRIMVCLGDPTETANWQLVKAPEDNNWKAVTYANSRFVAVADGGANNKQIMYAINPVLPWTAVESPLENLVDITSAKLNGRWTFAAVRRKYSAGETGAQDMLMHATDPSSTGNWKVETLINRDWVSIAWANGYWVVVSHIPPYYHTSPIYAFSTDLINWEERYLPDGLNDAQISQVCGQETYFVVINRGDVGDTLAWTADPSETSNWKSENNYDSGHLSSITYGGGYFVGMPRNDVGNNHKLTVLYTDKLIPPSLFFDDKRLLTEDDLEGGDDVDLTPYAKLDDDEQSITAKEFIGDGSKLTNLPDQVLEGALIFKGTVADTDALPTDGNETGHLYYVTADEKLVAWGEDDAWHDVGTTEDVNLDEYARLDGAEFTDTVTIKDPNNAFTRVELSTTSIGSNQQNQGFSLMKAHELALISLFDSEIFISPFVLNDGDPDHGESVIRAKKAKATLHSITLDNNNRDIPDFIEGAEFRPGYLSLVHRSGSSGFEVDGATTSVNAPDFTVTAKEFIGDGSKLTNLPGGGAVPINEVLAEGNETDLGQKIILKATADDLPYVLPSGISIPDFELEANYGTFIRGLHTRYQASEDIVFEDGDNTLEANWAIADISPRGFEFKTTNAEVTRDGSLNAWGLRYSNHDLSDESKRSTRVQIGSEIYISYTREDGSKVFECDIGPEHDSNHFKLDGTIEAVEFIGDGSKLTGIDGMPDFRTLTPLT